MAEGLPGRNEILSENPLVVIDGAHNPPKIKAALDIFSKKVANRELVILYSAKRSSSANPEVQALLDKRQKEIFLLLAKLEPSTAIFTEFKAKGIWHADDASRFMTEFQDISPETSTLVINEVDRAFDYAKQIAGFNGAILVIGSFHLAGEVRDQYQSKADLLLEL